MTTTATLQQKINEDFWISRLGEFAGARAFKKGYGVQTGKRSATTLPVPADLCNLLEGRTLGKAHNKLLFLNVAVYCWLKRFSARNLQLIANRACAPLPDAEPSGLVFLRLGSDAETTVRQCLRLVHDAMNEGQARSGYDPGMLADRYFSMHSGVSTELAESGVFYRAADSPKGEVDHTDSVNLCLTFDELPGGLAELQLTSKGLELTADDLRVMGKQVITILEKMCSDIDVLIRRLDIVPPEEKEIYNRINDSGYEIPSGSFLGIFDRMVRSFPDKEAAVDGSRSLSYRELDRLSNGVAARLVRVAGVRPEELVAVMVGHDLRRIIAILGVLKAGAGYVPIKAEFPVRRIAFMVQDCGCRTMVADADMKARVGELPLESVILLPEDNDYGLQPDSYECPVIRPAAPFVILYTSGSSGTPKGVLIEHRNMYDRLMGEIKFYDLDEHICTIQTSNYAFDSSLLELFLPFVLGGRLVIPTEQELGDYEQLAGLIQAHRVTDLQANPNFLRSFMDACVVLSIRFPVSFKRIWSGGESLNGGLVNLIRKNFPGIMLSNHYGPTEGTIDAIINKDIRSFDRNIIGVPLYNMKVVILDEDNNMQPVNFPGEICVSGNGIARGYLNLPDLTAGKFVAHPFDPGGRMYRTGDMGRMLGDGNIEYLGRIDDQIKIRGYRVEPAEIEHTVMRFPAAADAVVLAKTDPAGMKYLTAYVIFKGVSDIAGLRAFLRSEMPDFMVPSYFLVLDRFPLNAAGKNDRNALAAMSEVSPAESGSVRLPENDIEARLLGIWQQVLMKDRISTDSSFFEIGGQSLKATQIMFRIYREFGVKLGLQHIFTHPTICLLAALISGSDEQTYSGIGFATVREMYEASPAQRRIWTICQDRDMSVAYNMPGAYLLEGELRKAEFAAAYRSMIRRHEALRTTFVLQGDGLKQRVHEHDRQLFDESLVLSGGDRGGDAGLLEAVESIAAFFHAPFDFEHGPLIKGNLIELAADKFLFLFSIHHIIADEWSLELFIHEFLAFYDRYAAGERETEDAKRLQYKDFSEHVSRAADTSVRQREYWRGVFTSPLPRLKLPCDGERTWGFGREGRIDSLFEPALKKLAMDFSTTNGVTPFITMLALFKVLLFKVCNQEDMIVGTISSGRNMPELESIIGLFVNTLALRSFPQSKKSFSTFFQEVRQHVLDAFANQDLEFEEVVGMIRPDREVNRHPLFDVLFEFQNATPIQTPHFAVRPYPYGHRPAAKFDLVVSVTNRENDISIVWTYNSQLFREGTVRKMADGLSRTASVLLENPEIALGAFDLMVVDHAVSSPSENRELSRLEIDENNLFNF